MFNLNIPTKEDIKDKNELVIAGTIAGSAVGLGLMYWIYSKAIEVGVSRGIKRGFGR